jgi:SAM-dependent methyltransferase
MRTASKWPKKPPELSQEQQRARTQFLRLWEKQVASKYSLIEKFNQGYPAKLRVPAGAKTLEVGAGIGCHLPFEDLRNQDYHVLEMSDDYCDVLRTKLPRDRVVRGNIEERQPFEPGYFDRVIAIHVLQRIRDLPFALREICRILKPGGFFDVVLTCEGGFAYGFARKLSTEPLFERTFGMEYSPIVRNDHVSTLAEIKLLLTEHFELLSCRHFPLPMPIDTLNLVVGYRFRKS